MKLVYTIFGIFILGSGNLISVLFSSDGLQNRSNFQIVDRFPLDKYREKKSYGIKS